MQINSGGAKSQQNCLTSLGSTLNSQDLIYFIKKFASNAKPVAKILIKFNSNKLEENEEEAIDIEFDEQKINPEIIKMQLILNDWIVRRRLEAYC